MTSGRRLAALIALTVLGLSAALGCLRAVPAGAWTPKHAGARTRQSAGTWTPEHAGAWTPKHAGPRTPQHAVDRTPQPAVDRTRQPAGAQTSQPAGATTVSTTPSAGGDALAFLSGLSDAIGSRVAGTPSEARAADVIADWFRSLGYAAVRQPFTFAENGTTRTSANVVATLAGSGPRQVVIGAHYDSVSVGRGAFDNASGVGLLLQLAAQLRTAHPTCSLVFVAFGAEEPGEKGSAAFFRSLTEGQRDATALMVNLDSVAGGDHVYCYSSLAAPWPQRAFRGLARRLGYEIRTSPGLNTHYPRGTTGDWSDHVAFMRHGIPYLYLEATNWLLGARDGDVNSVRYGRIWHTRRDTLTYLQRHFPGRLKRQLNMEAAVLRRFLVTAGG